MWSVIALLSSVFVFMMVLVQRTMALGFEGIRTEMTSLRGEVGAQIGGLRAEMHGEIKGLQGELHAEFAKVHSRIDGLDRDVQATGARVFRRDA